MARILNIVTIGFVISIVVITGVWGFATNDSEYSFEQNVFGMVFTGLLGLFVIWAVRTKSKKYNGSRAFSPETKDKALRRQNYRCKICGTSPSNWDYDHIVPYSEGGDNSLSNCQALCLDCHRDKTNRERAKKGR
jgi:hypothetical protein